MAEKVQNSADGSRQRQRQRSFSPVNTTMMSKFSTRRTRSHGTVLKQIKPSSLLVEEPSAGAEADVQHPSATATPEQRPPRRSMQLRRRAPQLQQAKKNVNSAKHGLAYSHIGSGVPVGRASASLAMADHNRDSMEAAAASQLPFRPQRQLIRQLMHMSFGSPNLLRPTAARDRTSAAMPDLDFTIAIDHEHALPGDDKEYPAAKSPDHDFDGDSHQDDQYRSDDGGKTPAGTACACDELSAQAPSSVAAGSGTYTEDPFGQLLHSTRSFKLYMASSAQLARNVPIWHLQRPVCTQRVAEITNTLKQRQGAPWLPGVISCFQLVEGGGVQRRRASVATAQTHGVIDGQHRLLACNEWAKGGGAEVPLLVQVFLVSAASDVKGLFLELNKAETVQEVDLPDALAPPVRHTIEEAVGMLQAEFAPMFKPSARCRPPHANAAVLRDAIFRSRLQQLGKASTVATLTATLQATNSRLGQTADAAWPVRLRGAPLTKARKFGFFIGLDMQRAIEIAEGI